MPTPEEKRDDKRALSTLRKVSLFGDTPSDSVQRLLAGAKSGSYRPRQVVYLPGDLAYGVHFVVSGRIKVSKVTRDGKELTLAYRTPGDFFGEPCLLDGGPREEMAEAMEQSTTIEVERVAFDRLLATHGATAFRFCRALIARRKDLEAKVEQLIFKDVGSKLAELLLRLAVEYGAEHGRGTLIALKITHQEMANLIGSTRETVSLTLSQFKRKSLIHTEGRKVIVADQEGLRAIA